MTLSELQQRYASGETPSQVIAGIYQAIRDWNDPALFIHLPEESELLDLAAKVESMPRDLPLWGIPFVVKDNIDVGGWPTTAACPEFAYIPEFDSEVVRLLRAAGAIPLGKTNLDQFATGLVGNAFALWRSAKCHRRRSICPVAPAPAVRRPWLRDCACFR